VRIVHRQQHLAEPGHQLGGILRALRQKILGLHPVWVQHVNVGQDHLQRPLEDLGLTANAQVVAGLERPGELFRGVPEPGADAAGLVSKLELKVEIALAVGP